MFVFNRYYYIYQSIIKQSQERLLDGVVEKHHIIPKSFGGSNNAYNISLLTPREHFICHKLLVKCTLGKYKTKMSYALWMMCNPKNATKHIVGARNYAFARQLFVGEQSNRIVTQKTRDKLSEAAKGSKRPWAIHNIPPLDHNGNAKVWDVITPDGETHRLIGKEFVEFCNDNCLNRGNFSTYGKTKGYTAVCHGNYHQYLKIR